MPAFATRVFEIRDAFRSRVAQTLEAALSGTAGHDEGWNAFLAALGIHPLAPEQRLAIRQAGVSDLRGALPVEVRGALEKLQRHTGDALRHLKREISAAGAELPEALSAFEQELAASVAEGVKAYIARARPAVTVGGIFANAMATTQRFADPGQTIATKRCSCCGAARPADAELTHCAFCGNEMFKRA